MNFKEILATAVGVALGVFLAGVLTGALQKMQAKNSFENDNS